MRFFFFFFCPGDDTVLVLILTEFVLVAIKQCFFFSATLCDNLRENIDHR